MSGNALLYVPRHLAAAEFPNLTVLSMGTPHNGERPLADEALSFELLETLCFWHNDGDCYLPTTWHMPKLNSLRFREYVRSLAIDTITAFFESYGHGIEQLDFDVAGGSATFQGIEAAIALCPKLEYVSLAEYYRDDRPTKTRTSIYESNFAQRDLGRVDIGSRFNLRDSVSFHAMILGEASKPENVSWRNVRFIDAGLSSLIPNLPYLFTNPPSEDEKRYHDIFGMQVVETRHCIYWAELLLTTDSEYSYIPSNWGSNSDSDSDSVTTDSSTADSDHASNEEDEQDHLSEAGALAIFSRGAGK